jgi:hypothetical protein
VGWEGELPGRAYLLKAWHEKEACFVAGNSSWCYVPCTVPLSFMVVVFWCVVYAVAGLIVLACVPGLRLTLLNVIAFLIGAFAGSAALLSVYGSVSNRRLHNYPDAIGLIGAVTGGTLLVWLKTRFIQTSGDTRFW